MSRGAREGSVQREEDDHPCEMSRGRGGGGANCPLGLARWTSLSFLTVRIQGHVWEHKSK